MAFAHFVESASMLVGGTSGRGPSGGGGSGGGSTGAGREVAAAGSGSGVVDGAGSALSLALGALSVGPEAVGAPRGG